MVYQVCLSGQSLSQSYAVPRWLRGPAQPLPLAQQYVYLVLGLAASLLRCLRASRQVHLELHRLQYEGYIH